MEVTRAIITSFRDVLMERGLSFAGMTLLQRGLSHYVRQGLFLSHQMGSGFSDAWETIKSRLRHDMIVQGVHQSHHVLIIDFTRQVFDRSCSILSQVYSNEENQSEGEPHSDDEYDISRPINIRQVLQTPSTNARPTMFDMLSRAISRSVIQRFLNEASEYQDRDDGLDQTTISSFESFSYSPNATQDASTLETTCVVCQEDFVQGTQCMRLPNCHHFFHQQCIVPWLQRRQTCPTCREHCNPSEQVSYSDESESDSNEIIGVQSGYDDDEDDYYEDNVTLMPWLLE